MTGGYLNSPVNDEIKTSGGKTADDPAGAGNSVRTFVKLQNPAVKETLWKIFSGKLQQYINDHSKDPLRKKSLAYFYNNMLTPDERRFIAGTDYSGSGTRRGMGRIIENISAAVQSALGKPEEKASGDNTMIKDIEKLFFPVTLRVEDRVMTREEIAAYTGGLPGPGDFTGSACDLMLGDHAVASGKIVAGPDDSVLFEVGETSMDGKEAAVYPLTDLLFNYPLNISAETGRKYIPVGEAESIGPGSVIRFDRLCGDPLDIVLEEYDMVIAEGDGVVIDENFGIRITGFFYSDISEIMDGRKSGENHKIEMGLSVPVRCLIGSRKLALKDFEGLSEGSIIEFENNVFSPVQVFVGEDIRLKGEVVIIGDNFGVRIVDENRGGSLRTEESDELSGNDEDTVSGQVQSGNDKQEDICSQEKPFALLEKVNPVYLLNFLRGEHPQTIALVLSCIDPALSAVIIANLPYHVQGDIARRIAEMKTVPSDVIRDMEKVFERKVSMLESDEFISSGGIDVLVEMLNMADRGTEKIILEYLEENDPDVVEEIKKRIFVFEDIVLLDDRSVQKVLREVDTQDIAKALRGCSAELQEKIFRNMSRRAAELLREDMDYMGPIRLRDVEESQQKIVNIIRKLEETGEIIVARSGEDELVV